MSRKRRRKSLWLERAEYVFYRATRVILRFVSVDRARWLGRWLGGLASRVFRSRTRLATANLKRTFPDRSGPECDAIARGCWRHFSGEIVVYVRDLDQSAEEVARGLDLAGREHLQRALARGKGLIVYSAHFGNWESAIAILPSFGLPFTVVARALDNELIERDARRGRERAVKVVHRQEAARELVAALKKREGVVMLPDQAVLPREGLLVPFLGRPAWTTTAPARLAIHFGAPLLGIFCLPEAGRIRVELQPPIIVEDLPEAERNEEFVTRLINDVISQMIRRHPQYWLWLHDRWKRAPETS